MSSVIASIEPVVITVPVSSAKVIVLSAGSVTEIVVSKSSAVAPSKLLKNLDTFDASKIKSLSPLVDV